MLDKILYNTVLCQSFSPCGKYLVAGNIYGQLAVFDLDCIFNPNPELLSPDYNKPKQIHTLDSGKQICSLVSTKKFLIAGTVNEIYGWDWKSVLNVKLCKPAWTVRIKSESIVQCDINCLWLTDNEERLYAGCGDNKVYAINLEDGSLVQTLSGHDNFVHCVHGNNTTQLISAGEDGLVLLWDLRTSKCQNKIEPYKNSKVARPDVGKWVGAASLGDDWLVCGGGPRLALWHLRSLDAVTVFDIPDHGIHVASFLDDCVLAGGTAQHLYQLSYSGDVRVELPVSSTTVYSAIVRTSPNKVISIAGSSMDIDLCTSFNYRDQVLHFR